MQHPIGGLDRSRAFQDQPPYTAPVARNVFPTDGITGRIRPGQRSGIKRRFPQQLGSGNPVRLLSSVTRVTSGVPTRAESDLTTTPDAAIWDQSTFGGGAAFTYDSVRGGAVGSSLRTALDIDTAKIYSIECDFARLPDPVFSTYDLEIRLFARYDNS